jgi:hypothetical protein
MKTLEEIRDIIEQHKEEIEKDFNAEIIAVLVYT